jgi:hypothetical protein
MNEKKGKTMNTTSKHARSSCSSSSSDSSSLDSKEHNRNSRVCGSLWSVHGPVGYLESVRHRYTRLWCKRWTCSHCGGQKATRLCRAIIGKAKEHDLRRLLTLTLIPGTCMPEESIAYLRKCWAKFRVSLERLLGSSISFIAVIELQRSGYAHLHALIDRYIDQSWISDKWHSLGGGFIVDIRLVNIQRVAPYLAKYLTMEIFLGMFKKRQRRYTTSRNIKLFATEKTGWRITKAPLEAIYHQVSVPVNAHVYSPDGRLDAFEIAEELPCTSRA